ncbi:MAG TPA: carboxypeptidase-like regulatory domain-containing protein [Chryseosolibacter sp.]|nr:carboxypeptidase-like regulatory domain-containing protein [Chryseosolibacter sp.]
MERTVTLSIPRPCTEKWDNFLPMPGGGFCQSCSKSVVDFTKMTDDEIRTALQRSPGKVCGRFYPDQLKTYTYPGAVPIKPGLALLKAAAVSALLLFVSKSSSAQPHSARVKTESVQEARNNDAQAEARAEKITVSGVVRSSEDGSVLPGVNVILKGTTTGTVTDIEGRFQLAVTTDDVLVFSFIGFETQEYQISKADPVLELSLNLTLDVMVLGEVATHDVYTERDRSAIGKLWTRVTEFVRQW